LTFDNRANVDEAVRAILLPDMGDVGESSLPTAADLAPTRPPITPAASGDVVATYEVRTSDLDQIQEYLLRGQRKRALEFALDRRMWSHAFLIASAIDKESWQGAVTEFLRAELAEGGDSNGRESLKAAYHMFSGQGQAAGSLAHSVSPQALSRWRETAAMIVSNRTASDSAALTSLGDALASNGWRDAAHVW
jgi:hypothetical protein